MQHGLLLVVGVNTRAASTPSAAWTPSEGCRLHDAQGWEGVPGGGERPSDVKKGSTGDNRKAMTVTIAAVVAATVAAALRRRRRR